MPFWLCYYHIVWSTKRRQPLIDSPQLEHLIFDTIRHKSGQLKAYIHAINAVNDHLHVAVSIPPQIAVARWVKDVKGISAYTVNERFPMREPLFTWQRGYGVMTFGTRNREFVVDYIERQKIHHQTHATIAIMERDEGEQGDLDDFLM